MIIRMLPEDEDKLRLDYLASETINPPSNKSGNITYKNDNTHNEIRDAVIEFQSKEGIH